MSQLALNAIYQANTPRYTSRVILSKYAYLLILFIILSVLVGSFLNESIAIFAFNIVQIFFASAFVYKIFLFTIAHIPSPHSDDASEQSDDSTTIVTYDNMPMYSIIVPLYKENIKTIRNLVIALSKLDYNKERLEVKLVLEEDDDVTLGIMRHVFLPRFMDILIVPNGTPKTKPRACNYAMTHVIGEYIVIYDAEDRPDQLQLIQVLEEFRRSDETVACVQCRLNYYNKNHNPLTKFFALEYLFLFKYLLPGLQKIGTFMPLGGTSNHFRREKLLQLQAWDPYNVTEDAELGVRIEKYGLKTRIINSTTWEESPTTIFGWIKQRSRWLKGYMQTFLISIKRGSEPFPHNGFKNNLNLMLFVGGGFMTFLLAPVSCIFITIFAMSDTIALNIGIITKCFIYINLSFFAIYPAITSYICFKEKWWKILPYSPFIIFYFALHVVASYIAAFELFRRPHYWQKTEHTGMFQ